MTVAETIATDLALVEMTPTQRALLELAEAMEDPERVVLHVHHYLELANGGWVGRDWLKSHDASNAPRKCFYQHARDIGARYEVDLPIIITEAIGYKRAGRGNPVTAMTWFLNHHRDLCGALARALI